jgi:hypothetical protein
MSQYAEGAFLRWTQEQEPCWDRKTKALDYSLAESELGEKPAARPKSPEVLHLLSAPQPAAPRARAAAHRRERTRCVDRLLASRVSALR